MNVIQTVIFDLCKPSAGLALFPGSPLAPTKKSEPGNEASAHGSPGPFSRERMVSRHETTPLSLAPWLFLAS